MEFNSKKPFDALIFDLGNTLIYFDGDWPEVISRAERALLHRLQSDGLSLDEEIFLAEFHNDLVAYYQERDSEFIEHTTLYVLRSVLQKQGRSHVPQQLLKQALSAFYLVTQQHWIIEDDTIGTLEVLRAMDYRLGIISNAGDDSDVQVLVDKAGVRGYFDSIVTSAAEGIRKPNPRIFQILLERWDLPALRAAMVGDTLGADVLGAQNASIYAIWITRRADTPANKAHSDTIKPDASIERLSDLPSLLRNL